MKEEQFEIIEGEEYLLLKTNRIVKNLGFNEASGVYKFAHLGTQISKEVEGENVFFIQNNDVIKRAKKHTDLRLILLNSNKESILQKNIFVLLKSEAKKLYDENNHSIRLKNNIEIYAPQELCAQFLMTTPFNPPKYLVRQIKYFDRRIHIDRSIHNCTLIIIDDDTKQISISLYIKPDQIENIDILDYVMHKRGFNKLCGAISNTIQNDDNLQVLFQNTYIKKDISDVIF